VSPGDGGPRAHHLAEPLHHQAGERVDLFVVVAEARPGLQLEPERLVVAEVRGQRREQ